MKQYTAFGKLNEFEKEHLMNDERANEKAMQEFVEKFRKELYENAESTLLEYLIKKQTQFPKDENKVFETQEVTGEMEDLIFQEAMFISRLQVVCREHYEKLYDRLRELKFPHEYEPKLFEYVMEEQISEGTDFEDFEDFLENS